MDDLLFHALLAGVGVALVTGPLGSFVVWRRMAYFGDALAHSALLGVVLGLLIGLDPGLGVAVVCIALALLLVWMQGRKSLASDTLLGILSHGALSVGLVAIGLMQGMRVDLMAYLFGDILAVGLTDLAVIWGGGVLVLAILAGIWRPLLSMTVHADLAAVEGVAILPLRLTFVLLIAVTVALALKVVGLLLVTSLLIIPAATARNLARTPESMALLAMGAGTLAVALGLWGAFTWDTAAGPSIVVAALVLFTASSMVPRYH
ncbi:metal ABC transporter permease [Magnetospira sp. QH-2]|uniref:metal ABC transporter permease n=1 Tax=Magnetospira sp. (strain QH-2) TaxID=1288970 RepID=UPI0003E817EC|nr:metal ABC transporter permease [Magnetospira sp. QH-2]CCQ74256.1 High-affinity zinc uptake system membrane protein znuB [Magnetospira sp. QH-2]